MPANAPARDGSEEREALASLLRGMWAENTLTPDEWADRILAAGFTRRAQHDGERVDREAWANARDAVMRAEAERDAAIRECDEARAAFDTAHTSHAETNARPAEAEAERDALAAKLEAVCEERTVAIARAEAAETKLAVLHGRPFSERDYNGLHARMSAAESRAAALAEPCTAAINALMALGSLIQNDHGTWKIRRHGQDMQAIVDAINRTVPLARAALAGNSGNGTGEGA